MFQQARTDLGVIVQVLSVPCDFHTGIYLCFPLILGDLKYKNNTKQPINNKRTCNHLSRFLQSNFDWSKPGDVEGALREAFAMKDRLVFMDFITDPAENVYPMMMAGKGQTEMVLSEQSRIRELA